MEPEFGASGMARQQLLDARLHVRVTGSYLVRRPGGPGSIPLRAGACSAAHYLLLTYTSALPSTPQRGLGDTGDIDVVIAPPPM